MAEADTAAELRTRLATLARSPSSAPLRFPRATPAPFPLPDEQPPAPAVPIEGAEAPDSVDDRGDVPLAEATRLPIEVEAAFLAQLTPALKKEALRLARQRAKWVHEVSRRVDPLYARELVQDAITDTWSGVLGWNPAACNLLDHVCVTINRRTSQARERLLKFPHRSIQDKPVPGEPLTVEEQATQAQAPHASQGDLNQFIMRATARAVVSTLRARLAGEPAALAVLDAWAAGLFERRDVMARTGLSERDYRLARDRVTSEATRLCPELRESAIHLLRRAS